LAPILENSVYGELLKLPSIMPETGFLSHYRDNDEVEVDFVLKSALREIAGKQFMTGIVIYDGKDALYFGDVLWAVPLSGP
jgi:predicted AAA+ superfamily ATPase